MATSALLGAGAFLGGTGSVAADEHDDYDDNGMDDGEMMDENGDDVTDIDILNFALVLEFLEADFYRQGLNNLGCSGLLEARALDDFGPAIRGRVFGDLEVVRDHEIEHAVVLAETIEELGGEPVEEPEFEFGTAVEDPDEFLLLGAELEDTGVSAYNGSIADIENPELVTAGATIATVEGRHASYLRVLTGEIGFPDVFDPTRTRDEVNEIASQFIVE